MLKEIGRPVGSLESSTLEPHYLSPGVGAQPTPHSELQQSSDGCRVPDYNVCGQSFPETYGRTASQLPIPSQPGFAGAGKQNPYAVARQVPGQPGRHLAMTRPVTGQSFSHDTTGPVSQFAMTRQGSHSLSGEMTGLQSNSYDAARQTVTHLNMTRPGRHSFHYDVASQSVSHVAMSRQGKQADTHFTMTWLANQSRM